MNPKKVAEIPPRLPETGTPVETAVLPAVEDAGPDLPAWERLHEGAYMPRRVRGSWRGGVLG